MRTSQLCSWSSFHLRSGSHTNVCSLSTRKRSELCQNCTRSYPSYRLICIYSNCSFTEFLECESHNCDIYWFNGICNYLFVIFKKPQLPHNAKSFWGFDSPNMVETDISETEETQGGFHAAADKSILIRKTVKRAQWYLETFIRTNWSQLMEDWLGYLSQHLLPSQNLSGISFL